jgi:hypothetical protein
MKKIKPLKAKLTPDQYEKVKGSIEAGTYKFDGAMWCKTIRSIRGIAAAKRKAKIYYLATEAGNTGTMYLTNDLKLSYDRKTAMPFYEGFDDPKTQIKKWQEITRVSLYDKH